MDSTQRRRRNSYDQPNQLQYRTNRGPIPLNVVPEQLQNAPPVGTRTASGYPDIYRNKEGLAKDSMQNFPTYTTGPGRAAVGSVAGILHEYPIQTPNDDHRFDYNRRVTPARKVEARQNVPPNQRAYVTNLPPPPPPTTPSLPGPPFGLLIQATAKQRRMLSWG